MCECGDSCCHEHLALPAADYERLLQHGDRLVVPGHEHGRVVDRGNGYVVCDA